ncbi:hypothetical protein [Nibricoccus sp. IMCC34717]|uniref:hypothetical protein n=1 Tax=Nibricoccus sp. IMCC34717 TaxID=3034021 RepID=UPI00384ADA4E
MKSTRTMLLLGVILGIAAHVGYFEWRRPAGPSPEGDHLAWLQSELHLSDAQYQRVVALHERNNPQLRQLAAQVMEMQREMQVFENTRRNEGKVDFVEFARFVDDFRRVSSACEDSTRSLVAATADVLDPDQRRRYLALVEAAAVHPRSRSRVQ